MEVVERNARICERMALFEIGPVFIASEDGGLPDEPQRLAIVLTGPRSLPGWQPADSVTMDFYDLKGILAALLDALHIEDVRYESAGHPSFHPGKQAKVQVGERKIGVFGELHPVIRKNYDLSDSPLLAAELDLDVLLPLIPERYISQPVHAYPPVLEDLALVVDETLPAERVAEVIRQAGGKIVTGVRLFDVFRGEKIGAGKKSLAYSLTYQVPNKTLTDRDVAGIRTHILRRLEQELGAALRS
jgi:phenylalanyl-tRNA synthetase beta chain